jgi:hypothetical protein
MEYVKLVTVASILGVTDSWLRGLIYKNVMDDERERQCSGVPHVMHVRQVFQAIVADRMRTHQIGYDLIRATVDAFDLDRKKKMIIPVTAGITLVVEKQIILTKARRVLEIANRIENGGE